MATSTTSTTTSTTSSTTPVNYQLTKTVNAIPDIFTGATFEEIKKNLIDWLKGQSEFQDYDFTGSRLQVLVDLLAYNTLYMQQFANTAVYESFLGTANMRSSVVQLAQDAGYYPAGKTAAQTSILLSCTHSLNPTSIRIPRGTKFLAYAKETSADPYSFIVLEDVIAVKSNTNTYSPIVTLAQGSIVRTELTYDPSSKIIIRDTNIDRDQVKLTVNGTEWVDWTDQSMVNNGSTSTIFYRRETVDGFTEFFFGEGVASTDDDGESESSYIGGLKPTTGATIVIEYLKTDGEEANGATEFSYADTLQYITINKITENYDNDSDYVGAEGGGDPDNIERIRNLATVKREAQNRCVTKSDYESFLSAKFGSIIQAVQCFTDSDKPGYAFISIKPKNGLELTSVEREDMEDYLDEYNIATITPSIMSPNYLFIKHDIKVSYALNKLQNSEQWLSGQIIDSITDYYTDDVEIFNASFSKSKMLTYVDDTDNSIMGSSATIQLVREISNFFSTAESGMGFNNVVNSGSVVSSAFTFAPNSTTSYPVNIIATNQLSNGTGTMICGPFKSGDITTGTKYTGTDFTSTGSGIYYDVGTINYSSDLIYWNLGILGLTSSMFDNPSIELYATPTNDVIFTKDGSLIVFENDLRPQYTTITLEPITQ